jgi:hypothetical protein
MRCCGAAPSVPRQMKSVRSDGKAGVRLAMTKRAFDCDATSHAGNALPITGKLGKIHLPRFLVFRLAG